MGKPILCLDFDGVMHSYASGWKGAAVIPDPPVKGMVEFLERAMEYFDIQVFSSRSHQDGGVNAMAQWLRTHVTRHFDCEFTTGAPRDFDRATAILNGVVFAVEKPAAFLSIDDRAMTFNGEWPDPVALRLFKPWNKR